VTLKGGRDEVIEQRQSDEKDKADGQAPADQFLLDRQQRLDGSVAQFVTEVRLSHDVLL